MTNIPCNLWVISTEAVPMMPQDAMGQEEDLLRIPDHSLKDSYDIVENI